MAYKDGNYEAEITLSGGSGRATVESPAEIHIENGNITAKIVWSSSGYDYMKVDNKEYSSEIIDNKSVFQIDIPDLGQDIPVVARTVAMSEPHYIDYTINISDKLQSTGFPWLTIGICAAVAVAFAGVFIGLCIRKKKRK